MIARVLEQRNALSKILSADRKVRHLLPSWQDLEILEVVNKALSPLQDFTDAQSESPKPVVIIKPDTQVFRGERVTFRCDMKRGGDTEWTYEWYRDGYTFSPYSTAQEFTVTDNYYSSGKYTCRGRRRDSQLSQISDPVTLSVSEKPKAVITSSPKGDVLTGNSVTLTCTLNVQSAGWKFYWITPTQSTETETAAQYNSYYYYYYYSLYTIRSVSVSDRGQYKCRAGRGNPVYYTQYSDALWVNVIGE
ncbi:low affinity immunoglobulin gamma Fc region receptor III-like [Clarias gariepinus]|uniref:low affinity immunoglobulin gamma Fc region receptor III-like n=1 Tax=Clarias gariepinus TaxID=13013 RepID=UPI00234D58C0|nr:low affinity immunoglobulin gamma Fc region receptor III-like [Clarias gariepinus]